MIDIFLAFWDGFTRPRPIALAGVCLTVLVQAALLTSPCLSRVDARYLMAGPNDYGAELTSEVMRLRQSHSDPSTMVVVHLGSSMSQEAIDGRESVTAELSAALGRPVQYWPLFMPDATLWELGALVEQVPVQSHGYVVLEVSPGMIGNKRDLPVRFVQRAETVLDSPFAEDELRKAGHPVPFRTGIALVDHAGFFSARRDNLWRWALRCPHAGTEGFFHRYSTATVRPGDLGDPLKNVTGDYEGRAALNDVLLEKVVHLAESRGLKVILLNMHYRPGVLAQALDIERAFAQHLSADAAKMKTPLIDPSTDAGLTADDYLDNYHLWKQPARLKFQGAFVQSVGDIIKREENPHAS